MQPPPERNLVGLVVRDRYEILRLLGQGGMGAVYAVRDRQGGQERALKVLGADAGGIRVAQHRFKREFSTISRLNHPNIVGVFDFGELSGTLFYVMELLTSTSLQTMLPRPGEPLDRAGIFERLRAVSGVIDALGYIHQQHLVHRDLKPSNLLFAQDGRIRITDFGLAKDFDNAITLTESGSILGTLSHMAPEQLQGRKIDHRADLYALGVLLYQLVSGRLPFNESNPLALMRQQVTSNPLAPSRHNPAIPRELDDVVLKLLARDPVDRFPTAALLAQDLAAVLKGEMPGATRAAMSSSDQRTILQTAAGYVGRQEELTRLQKVLEEAGAGHGGVALITGEAGVGKTRFVEEFCARALLFGVTFLKGRADRRAGVFYRPFIEMIEGYNGRLGQYDTETEAAVFSDIGRVLSRLVPRLLERKTIAEMPEPPALEPRENKVRLFDAVTRLLLRLAQQDTLVLFFDDFQHVDELSLELFQYLGRNARGARLVLIAAVRGEDISQTGSRVHPVEAALALLRREGIQTETIALRRLTESETSRMARGLSGQVELSTEFLGKLWGRTAGVPYFVEELMRWLRDQGAIETGQIPEDMPATVEAVLRERLEGIPEGVLGTLRAAAVCGEEFEFEVLLRATGEPEGQLLDAVDLALRMKVLKERPGERYAFVHPLLRMMLYSKLLPRKRRLMHQAIARALEESGAALDTGREAAEALAYHWTGAGEREKALVYQIQAGQKAKAAYANEAARQHLEAAARVLEDKGDLASRVKLFDVLESLCSLASIAGSSETSEKLAQRMVFVATDLGDNERKALALKELGLAEQTAGKYAASQAHLLEARDTAAEPALRGQCMAFVAFQLSEKLGRAQEGLAMADEALKVLEGTPDISARYAAFNARGVSLLRAGRIAEAEAQMRRTVEFARANNRRIGVCNGLNNLSVALEAQGKSDERIAILRQALEAAREMGYLHGEALYLVGLSYGLMDKCDPDAEPVAKQALELAKRAGYRTSVHNATGCLAQLAYQRADFAGCRKLLEEPLADPELNIGNLVEVAGLDADAAIRLGKSAEAVALIESTTRRVGSGFESTWAMNWHVHRAGMLLDAGQPDACAEALELIRERMATWEARDIVAEHRFIQARLAAVRGDAETALRLFRESTTELYKASPLFRRENFRVLWAAAMARLDRPSDARSGWERAEAELLKAGLQPYVLHLSEQYPQLVALLRASPTEARTEVRPAPPSALLGEAPPLVGRDAELAWIRERLKQVKERKEGGFAVWRGAPGIGRTRMMRELTEHAERMGTPAYATAVRAESRSAAHGAVLPILRQALDRIPPSALARDVAGTIRKGIPELGDHRTLVAAAPGETATGAMTPEQERVLLHDAVARLFEAATGHGVQPIVLALDDAGAADEASLDLLAALGRSLRSSAVLIVLSASSDDMGEGHPLPRRLAPLLHERIAQLRELAPLSARDISTYVETVLGAGRKHSAELAAIVAEKSCGNPLFAREMLLAMFRTGLVQEDGDGWTLKTRNIALPDTIVGLLKHQLEGIEAANLRVLAAASVLGREFEFDLLMEVTTLDERALLDRLEAIVTHGILEAVRDDPLGRDLYRFPAPQMREVLYSGLAADERAGMHRRAGDALERAQLSKRSVSAGELAHHFTRGGGGRKARDWSLEAGRKAVRACANSEALAHLDAAMKLMKGDPALLDREKLFEALLLLASVASRTGDTAAARRRTEEALVLAETPAERMRVSRALVQALHRAGDLRGAVAEAERAVRAFGKEEHGKEGAEWFDCVPAPEEVTAGAFESLVGLLNTISVDCLMLGNRETAARSIGMALALADRSGRPEISASALRPRANLLLELGQVAEAREAHEKALRLWRAAGSRWDEAATLNNLAGVDMASGNLLTSLERYAESAKVFQEVGDLIEYARQLTNIGRAQLDLGQWADAERTLAEALEANQRLGERRSVAFVWTDLARLHAARDRRDEALAAVREGLAVAGETGIVQLASNLHAVALDLS
ncbi:MAG: AAA family ATPase, partial [Candidatus Brocadiae bacterium]|nr:AAA family ATPase [Candidatus Brocadiia bacterium]